MSRGSRSIAALGVAGLLAGAGGAYALATSSGSKITVCVKHRGGLLYMASRCARHDKKLSWNVQGPAGATGPQGIQGKQGLPGTAGAQGIQGLQGNPGPSGISSYQIVTGVPENSSGGGEDLASDFAFCPVGTRVLGGGFTTSGADEQIFVKEDQPSEGTPAAWFVQTTSANPTAAYKLSAWAVCAKVSS